MKCPNIWCIGRNLEDGSCWAGDFIKGCLIRKAYEKEFCPTEEEYNCNNCGSVCVEVEKDTEGNIVCPNVVIPYPKQNLCVSCYKYTNCQIKAGEDIYECDEYEPLF